MNRDQVRENVLVKQYYCDVDIAHLISYNEELAHKLQTEPADTIPLVRRFFTHHASCLQASVRSCTEAMHQPYRLPLTKTRRPPPPPTSAPPTLLCLHHLYQRSQCDQHISSRPYTGHRHWCLDSLLKSHRTFHTMSKLPAHGNHPGIWRHCRSLTASRMLKKENGRR